MIFFSYSYQLLSFKIHIFVGHACLIFVSLVLNADLDRAGDHTIGLLYLKMFV